MALPSPETGSHPDSNAPALQGPPHPTPKEPAARSIAPLLRTALQCHRQRPDCLASRILHAHRCAPLGGGRSHGWRSERRGAQGTAGLGQSEGPTSFRGRWTQLTRKGLLGQGPLAEGAEAGGGERGWEVCETAPSDTARSLEGLPAALTDERLQALARGRVPDPTAKRHRTQTVKAPAAAHGARAPQDTSCPAGLPATLPAHARLWDRNADQNGTVHVDFMSFGVVPGSGPPGRLPPWPRGRHQQPGQFPPGPHA